MVNHVLWLLHKIHGVRSGFRPPSDFDLFVVSVSGESTTVSHCTEGGER